MSPPLIETIGSIVAMVCGVCLLIWTEERDLGIGLLMFGMGTRAGSFTRGRVAAAK